MVHHSGRAQALALRGAAALVCAVALGGCLGGTGSSSPTSAGAGAGLGESARTADCAGWRAAGPQERQSLIADVRGFAGGPVGSGDRSGATLPNGKAYDLFEGSCRAGFAAHFKLYKLYTRAAAFQNLPRR
jgi:hypothetical protein